MKIDSPIIKLDVVLKVLSEYNEGDLGTSIRYIIINSNGTDNVNLRISHQEIELILSKLIKDEYVILKSSHKINDGENRYFITFEGAVFNELGGYEKKSNIENRQLTTSRVLNFAIAIGGGMAALYYLLEIIKYYGMPVFQYLCKCEFFWQK